MRIVSFFKSDFTKNSLTLSFGTAIAQVIPFVALLYFARVFTEEAFGVFSLFMQCAVVLTTVANGRLEQPLLVEREDSKVRGIFYAALNFSLLFSIIIFFVVLILVLGPNELNFIGILGNSAFYLPVSMIFGGWVILFTYLINRWKAYYTIAKGKILQSLISNLIPFVCLFFWRADAQMLIIGFLLGQIALLAYLYNPTLSSKSHLRVFLMKGEKQSFKQVLQKYRAFPTINMPFLLVDQLSGIVPLLFIAYFYGDSAAGQAGLAFRSLLLPVALISGAVAQVYYKKAIDTVHVNHSLRRLVIKVFGGLFLIGLIFFLPVTFFAPALVPWMFGSKWQEAGVIMALLSLSMIIKFPVSPLGNTFVVVGRIKAQAAWQILILVTNLLLVATIFFLKASLITYIWFLVALEIIMYIIYLGLMLKVSSTQ